MLALDDNANIQLWDTASGKLSKTLVSHHLIIDSLSFSTDGKILASAGWDATIQIWDVIKGEIKEKLIGHKHAVNSVSFSPDGMTLASTSYDGTVLIWDMTSEGNINEKIDTRNEQ